eukprot:UN03704
MTFITPQTRQQLSSLISHSLFNLSQADTGSGGKPLSRERYHKELTKARGLSFILQNMPVDFLISEAYELYCLELNEGTCKRAIPSAFVSWINIIYSLLQRYDCAARAWGFSTVYSDHFTNEGICITNTQQISIRSTIHPVSDR